MKGSRQKKEATKEYSIRLTDTHYKVIEQMGKDRKQTRSAVVRFLLEEEEKRLDRQEANKEKIKDILGLLDRVRQSLESVSLV